MDFDGEGLGMPRTSFRDYCVAGWRQFPGLSKLLKGALIIGSTWKGKAARITDNEAGNDFPHRLDATVEIDRRNQSLERVGQQGFLAPAAAEFFTPSKKEILSQIELLGNGKKVGGTDEMGFEFRKTALGNRGIVPNQSVADEKSENGIPEKLQLLVVDKAAPTGGVFLMYQRAVGQRANEKVVLLKAIADGLFESLHLRAHLTVDRIRALS